MKNRIIVLSLVLALVLTVSLTPWSTAADPLLQTNSAPVVSVTVSPDPAPLDPNAKQVALVELGQDAVVTDDTPLLTYQWSAVSGPGPVTFQDPSSLKTVATFYYPGDYVLQLLVDDGEYQVTDTLPVTVTAN